MYVPTDGHINCLNEIKINTDKHPNKRLINKYINSHTNRQTHMQTDKDMYEQIHSHINSHINSQISKETPIRTGKLSDKWINL